MTDLKKLKERVVAGESVEFNNEKDCEINQHDDLRGMTVEFRENAFGRKVFKVWFEGRIVQMGEIFPEKKIRDLISKWKLEEVRDVENC